MLHPVLALLLHCCLTLAGLGADSDRTLKAFGKKVQAEAVKAGCNATGACPIPKTSTSSDGAAPPGSEETGEKVDVTLPGNTISAAPAAPASAASGDTGRQVQQQQ